jgi:hypothetical protein
MKKKKSPMEKNNNTQASKIRNRPSQGTKDFRGQTVRQARGYQVRGIKQKLFDKIKDNITVR